MFPLISFRRLGAVMLVLCGLVIAAATAHAARPAAEPELSPLAIDLAALLTQGQAVDAELAAIDLSTASSCTELGAAGTSAGDWVTATDAVLTGINTAFSVDTESLTSLDDLSNLTTGMAARLNTMSVDLTSFSAAADLVEYDASLAAMLRLSDDIGSMAGRIGEMADRILVMADNIGLMADRILITQQLQSANVVLTQNSLLATQQNLVALNNTFSTQLYDPTLAALLTQAQALDLSMGLTSLNTLNMSVELARIEGEVGVYLNGMIALYTLVSADSSIASHLISGDTLTWAGDLSTVHRSLALSLQSYADRINQIAPFTSTPILADATASMLRLAYDIGVMSDRIMEMVDRIVVMGDNIGLMSVRIVDTQNLQQTNIEFTQASLASASATTVNVISAYGL